MMCLVASVYICDQTTVLLGVILLENLQVTVIYYLCYASSATKEAYSR